VKTLAIVNRKGGAGKTTVTLHLGVAAMKTAGLKVGIVDMDPQKSALVWSRTRGVETAP
jgi:chromosome partitioning protein